MSASKQTLSTFGAFAGIAKELVPTLVEAFAQAHPELVTEDHPDAPPSAPADDIDPEVRAAIERGGV